MCHADVTDSKRNSCGQELLREHELTRGRAADGCHQFSSVVSLVQGYFSQSFSNGLDHMATRFCTRLSNHHSASSVVDQVCATIDTPSKLKTPRSVGVAGLVGTLRSTVSPYAKVCVLRRRHCYWAHRSESKRVPTTTEKHADMISSAVFPAASTRGWRELMIGRNYREWLRTFNVQMS